MTAPAVDELHEVALLLCRGLDMAPHCRMTVTEPDGRVRRVVAIDWVQPAAELVLARRDRNPAHG